MKIITTLVLLLITKVSISQKSNLENILPLVSLLQAGNTSSSGFFIGLDDNILFVTAKHSLINEFPDRENKIQRTPIDNFIKIVSYPKDVTKNKPDTLDINFGASSQANFIRYGLQKDVIILFIGKLKVVNDTLARPEYQKYVSRVNKGTWLNFIPFDNFEFFNNAHIGEDIIMGGYPKSLGLLSHNQYNFNRPLIRKGIVAGKTYELGNIIIDCPSYGGNSGGPIFVEKQILKSNIIQKEYKLLGLVSGFVPYNEVWYNQNYQYTNMEINNSGFSEIIPIDIIVSLYLELKPFLK